MKRKTVGGDAFVDPLTRKINSNKGITLVALVITIIVLLILAGITISLTLGEHGILNMAKQAGINYQDEAKKEDEDLRRLLEESKNIIADKYTMVDGVPVPNGFKHLEGTKDTGFVIQDISGTKTNGNEYVWVPCTIDGKDGSIKYDRYAFSTNDWVNNQTKGEYDSETNSYKITRGNNNTYYYTETIPAIGTKTELDSIKTYGGFYIGRYEVGIVGYDSLETSNSNNLTNWTGYNNGTAVVQKGKQVWNRITRGKAKEVAEDMYKENDVVSSRLCSSYAWDTTLKFIETKHSGYAISTQGNYKMTEFEYIDLDGKTQKKESGKSIIVPTGQTIAVNNIYDMGGNVWEWTSEIYSNETKPYTLRGGDRDSGSTRLVAERDTEGTVTRNEEYIGFRQTLFIVP